MNEPAIRQPSANRRWPMTGEAWLTLVDELGQLRVDVAALAGPARQTTASSISRPSRPPADWTCCLRCSMPLRRFTNRIEPSSGVE